MGSHARSREVPVSLSPSGLRRSCGIVQAAAVCYRVNGHEIEFLLVRTRAGRWTFPKGGIEPGLSHAQSAALEAFEEAGVHGRIEVTSFARYARRLRTEFRTKSRSTSRTKPIPVFAFLCEVRRLGKPQESKRNRTWFSAEKTKRRLREGRTEACAAELAAVVDRAVARVRRLHGSDPNPSKTHGDALQRVCFESWEIANPHRLRVSAHSYIQRFPQPATASAVAFDPRPQKLLPAHIEQVIPPERLSKTVAHRPGKITAIDAARR